jgi:hypothetical protein
MSSFLGWLAAVPNNRFTLSEGIMWSCLGSTPILAFGIGLSPGVAGFLNAGRASVLVIPFKRRLGP